jgi:hypothetical protein
MGDFTLSFLLMILGCAAAVIGVFGDTLREGKAPIVQRITGTGWLTFACAVAMLAVGIVQQVRSAHEADEAETRMEEIRKDAQDSRADLEALEATLKTMQSSLAAMQTGIAGAGKDPATMKTELLHLENLRFALETDTMKAQKAVRARLEIPGVIHHPISGSIVPPMR